MAKRAATRIGNGVRIDPALINAPPERILPMIFVHAPEGPWSRSFETELR